MPGNTASDIEFQPKANEYSFTTQKPPDKKRKLLNTFFALILIILVLLFLFSLVLGILNYFNIISLSSYFPSAANNLPKVSSPDYLRYDQQSKIWSLSGTFDGYDDTNLQVKYKGNIIFLLYDQNSLFYVKKLNIKVNANLADFKTPKAVNKHINASFKINQSGNIIKEIILFQEADLTN